MSEITCSQAARLWNLTPRRVQIYCAQGRLPGARRAGRMWLLPADAQKPRDPRAPLTPSHPSYWPRLLLLDGDLMRLDHEEQMLALAGTDAEKKQLAAEIAYMRGDYKAASHCLEGVREEDPSYLAAVMISSAARISGGDIRSFQVSWHALSDLCARLADDPGQRIMAELAQGALAISAFAPGMSAPWLREGLFPALPAAALPFALYLRGKALLALGRMDELLGMAEGALNLLPRDFGIQEAYLYIMLAHAYLYRDQLDKARDALMRAIDICLPKGFLSPLAENISSLLGLTERCLQETYPDQLPKVLSLHKTLSGSWLEVHNFLTREQIATILTRREYQVALSVAGGLTNRESARRLGLSPSTLKGYLQSIYQKLNITNRKALKEYVVTA